MLSRKPNYEELVKRIRKIYIEERIEKESKCIKIIDIGDINRILPYKVKKVIEFIDKNIIKYSISPEDYSLYLKIKDKDFLKKLSKKYSIDFISLNGYKEFFCKTEDEYLSSLITKIQKSL